MEPVVKALTDLNEAQVLSAVEERRNDGIPPLEIVQQLQQGMRLVGDRFQSGEYFLSELIMSAEIFKRALHILDDVLTETVERAEYGKFVIGTAEEDIHDIGKNIVSTVLGCHGFEVIDLGVNVPPTSFVQAVKEHRPGLVGLSCLLTTAFDSMKRTVQAIEDAGLREGMGILIGGAPVTQLTCDYVGADAFCLNANRAVETAKEMCGGHK